MGDLRTATRGPPENGPIRLAAAERRISATGYYVAAERPPISGEGAMSKSAEIMCTRLKVAKCRIYVPWSSAEDDHERVAGESTMNGR